MKDFKRVAEEGTIEEKRSFLRAFCQKIELSPGTHQGRALFYAIPEPSALAKDSSLILVAGACYEGGKKKRTYSIDFKWRTRRLQIVAKKPARGKLALVAA